MSTSPTDHWIGTRPVAMDPTRAPFYYIQRLLRGTTWLHGLFELEHMAHDPMFRLGPDASLQRMYACSGVSITCVKITRGDITNPVYFIGATMGMEEKITAFRQWFSASFPRCLESSRFPEIFADDLPFFVKPHHVMPVAWLSLNNDIFWTLDQTVARNILNAINRSR